MFFLDLFNLYSDMIMRELDEQEGFVVGGHNINTMCMWMTQFYWQSQKRSMKATGYCS